MLIDTFWLLIAPRGLKKKIEIKLEDKEAEQR